MDSSVRPLQNWWYDTHDTEYVDPRRHPSDSPFDGWHSRISDSYFSGVVFRFVPHDDTIICGTYFS